MRQHCFEFTTSINTSWFLPVRPGASLCLKSLHFLLFDLMCFIAKAILKRMWRHTCTASVQGRGEERYRLLMIHHIASISPQSNFWSWLATLTTGLCGVRSPQGRRILLKVMDGDVEKNMLVDPAFGGYHLDWVGKKQAPAYHPNTW